MRRFHPFNILVKLIFLVVFGLFCFEGCADIQQRTPSVFPTDTPSAVTQRLEPPRPSAAVVDARRIVQESSRSLGDLVRKRPAENPFKKGMSPADAAEQKRIDVEIAAIERQRSTALVAVAMADNPGIEILDPETGRYRVTAKDHDGQTRWFSGNILPVWHFDGIDPSVFTIAELIRSRPEAAALPAQTQVTAHLLLAGTSSQSLVHPYPGDIDLAEEYTVTAPDAAAVAEAMAAVIVEFVGRTASAPRLQFDLLRIMPTTEQRVRDADYNWPHARILDPSQRRELASQILSLGDGGRINTEWHALTEAGRYPMVGKILGIRGYSSKDGKPIYATQWMGNKYQQLFFGEEMPQADEFVPLGEYAGLMRHFALDYPRKERYLKASKRAFNYFRTIGDLAAMDAATFVFKSPEAEISQQVKTLESLVMALDSRTPSRILPVETARRLLRDAADVIEARLPVMPGTLPERPRGVALQLRAMADALHGRADPPKGILAPDDALKARLDTLVHLEIKPVLNLSLKPRVEQIIDTHAR